MKEMELESGKNGLANFERDWDVETIIKQILSDMNGAVRRSTIQEVLKDIIPKYEGARVQIYVPIFIHRDAIKRLKSIPASAVASDMAISDIALNEADEINNDQTNFESLRRIFRDEQSKTISAGLAH
jgi:hypothetical protein